MNFIDYEGIAILLAAKLCGRAIGRVVQGFDDRDGAITAQLSVYKAIQEKYPETTIAFPTMYKRMLRDASQEIDQSFSQAVDHLPEEQQAMWKSDGGTEHDRYLNALPQLSEYYANAPADVDAWNDLETIAQWSLLVSLETGRTNIDSQLNLYRSWLEDAQKRGTSTERSEHLVKITTEGKGKLHELLTQFHKKHEEELMQEAAEGTNVPQRRVA